MKARRMSYRSLGLALLCALFAGCATPPPAVQVQVKILALNDFHGNLIAPPGGLGPSGPGAAVRRERLAAGGAEAMATLVAELRTRNPNTVFVAAGDLIGATPLLSALLHDEPTIEAFNLMGLEASAMGNHELDRGQAELLRLQSGGCHPQDGCKGSQPFKGASFQYLAANTVVQATGKTLLPPYVIKKFQGVAVAFVGLTLKNTPSVVAARGIEGLLFRDEAQTVNALVPELQSQGVQAIVLLMHQGGASPGDYNECPELSGPVVEIVKRLHPAVAVVISGHTHRAYNCKIDGRVVTSADRYGTLLTQIDIVLDPQSGRVVRAEAENLVVSPERWARQPAMTALIERYQRLVAPLAERVVGRLSVPLTVNNNAAGESLIGRAVADSQLEATREAGAQIAFMNPGGVRSPLGASGRLEVSYQDLFSVQPFYNPLITMTLSGAQIVQMLEQQFVSERPRNLYVSEGFSYTWDAARPAGARVLPGSVMLGGRPLDLQAPYRVTMNSFLAEGGDAFSVPRQGTERRTGMIDVDAFEAYFRARAVVAPDPQARITRLN